MNNFIESKIETDGNEKPISYWFCNGWWFNNGGVKIDKQINNDPAIAKAVIEAYRSGWMIDYNPVSLIIEYNLGKVNSLLY